MDRRRATALKLNRKETSLLIAIFCKDETWHKVK